MLKEQDIAFILNVSTQSLGTVSCNGNGCFVTVIVRTKSLLNVVGSLHSIVVRHGGEEVVRNVRISNVVLEIINAKTIGTVNSKSSSTLEVPDLGRVMWQCRVSVL